MWMLALSVALAVPTCLQPDGRAPADVLLPTDPDDAEVLARLVYAEATSTGFPDDADVHLAIAWGATNRVRLAERWPTAAKRYGTGVRGVVFQRGQFNPAVSPRSRFRHAFLCPDDEARWALASAAASTALSGTDNPFVQTEWERQTGLSLVVNFYYPKSVQARGPLAPWEHDGTLVFLGDVALGARTLSADRVRFYRLAKPPTLP
jgi:hypothetical protein